MSTNDEMPEEDLWERSRSDVLDERADSLMELAHRKKYADDWTLAKNLYGSATDLYKELDRPSDAGHAIYSLGYCQYRLGEYQEAVESLKESLALGKELNDSKVIAYSCGPLADSYSALDRHEEAISSYELAVETFVEIDDQVNAGINCLSLGELHGIAARQTKALECFIRAFNIFQIGGDAIGAARAKDRMASALIELGDYEQAIEHIRDSVNTFEFVEAEGRVAHGHYRLGWTLNLAGKYLQAEPPLLTAIKMFRAEQDWSRAALAETQLAYSLIFRDLEVQNLEAIKILDRVASYFEAAGEIPNVLQVNSIGAERLMIAGEYSKAAAVWKDILQQALDIEDHYSTRSARVNLAECLLETGEVKAAQVQLGLIEAADWGENNLELQRLERVTNLMMSKLEESLNIEVTK